MTWGTGYAGWHLDPTRIYRVRGWSFWGRGLLLNADVKDCFSRPVKSARLLKSWCISRLDISQLVAASAGCPSRACFLVTVPKVLWTGSSSKLGASWLIFCPAFLLVLPLLLCCLQIKTEREIKILQWKFSALRQVCNRQGYVLWPLQGSTFPMQIFHTA